MQLQAYINQKTGRLYYVDAQNRVYEPANQLKGVSADQIIDTASDWLTLILTGKSSNEVKQESTPVPSNNTTGTKTNDPKIIVVQQPKSSMPGWLLPAGIALVAVLILRQT